jgi:hypothetical protein
MVPRTEKEILDDIVIRKKMIIHLSFQASKGNSVSLVTSLAGFRFSCSGDVCCLGEETRKHAPGPNPTITIYVHIHMYTTPAL